MIGKNFLKSDMFDWEEDKTKTICLEQGYMLFTVFSDTRRNELINAFNAGLQMGMKQGRSQKNIELLAEIFRDS